MYSDKQFSIFGRQEYKQLAIQYSKIFPFWEKTCRG